MKTNQKGFAHLGIFLLLIVVAAIVCTGIFVFKQRNKQGAVNQNTGAGSNTQGVGPDCGSGKQLLKASPVAVGDLSTIIPMGNFAPPGHINPTPHMYFNFINQGSASNPSPAKTTLYAPGDITITSINLFDNASATTPFNSYRLDFSVCKQVTGYFIHVVTLSDKLNAAMQPPYDHTQVSKISDVKDEHAYQKNVNIKLSAGEVLGTSGGGTNRPYGVDFGFVDYRQPMPTLANPARWKNDSHYACSLDYFPADLSAQLYKHIGNYSYQYVEPGDPKCGTVYQDVPGSAQGTWFTRDVPKDNLGDPALAATLGFNNFNHAQSVFSLGSKIQSTLGINTSATYIFTPNASGNVNAAFNKVKPGQVYCYQLKPQSSDTAANVTLLLEMTDASTLRIGTTGTSSCGSGPWQVGSKYIEYVR